MTGPGPPEVLRAITARDGPQVRLARDGETRPDHRRHGDDAAARCLRDQPVCLPPGLGPVSFCDCAGARALRWVLRRAAVTGSGPRRPSSGSSLLMSASGLLAGAGAAPPARRAPSRPGPAPHPAPCRP